MNEPPKRRVSVIIPARNEEANIERVVRSVAVQEDVLEILAVDDQSVDRTAQILERLTTQIPGLRVVRTASLPEGWLGKNHALATGSRMATGEWLLFTDADTDHRPGSLRTLLDRAEREGAALLSISPGQHVVIWWEKAVIPLIYVRLSTLFRFEEVTDPRSSVAAANGQYILVQRSAYDRAGGHAAVRGEVLEDVELAHRIKGQGGRIVFLPGASWVTTRMYRHFNDMWNGWTKNLFLLYGRDLGRVMRQFAGIWAANLLPVLVMLVAGLRLARGRPTWLWALAAGLGLLQACFMHWQYSRRLGNLGFPLRFTCYLVPGAVLFGLLLLNSAYAYRRGGTVVWKGRMYKTETP